MNCHLPRLCCLPLILLAIRPVAFATVWDINVNTEMTEEGRKLEHPTVDHPVYYYPYAAGYREIGTPVPGNKPPAEDSLKHHLAEALASQGYLVTHIEGKKLDPSPSLVLVFRWGNIKSVMYETEGMPEHDPRAYGHALHLVGAGQVDTLNERQLTDVYSAADDDRYYVTIAAYDFATYFNHHKKLLLWVTRMSIPKQELDMEEVVIPLIKTGTPFLGRETTKPRVVDSGGPTGKVEVGTPIVKGIVAPTPAQLPVPPK